MIQLLSLKENNLRSLQPEGILYNSNCVFIDEAGFNIINMVIKKAEQEQNI